MRAIILVAGVGERLRPAFADPKCLLPISGVPLIERYFHQLGRHGIEEVVLVVGYRKDRILDTVSQFQGLLPVRIIENAEYRRGGILSLWSARDLLEGDVLLMDGDVYFEAEVLDRLCNSPHSDVLPVDTTVRGSGEEYMAGIRQGMVVELGRQLEGEHPLSGEWVGFTRLSAPATRRVKTLVTDLVASGCRDTGYEIALEQLVLETPIPCEPVAGLHWIEIDFPEDIRRAEALASQVRA